jgi:hypothetical protein
MSRNKSSNKSFLQKFCDSSAAKTIGLVSAIVGLLPLGSIPYNQATVTIKQAAPAPLEIASRPGIPLLPRPTSRSTAQSSFGAQSPNVSGVQLDVQMQYAFTTADTPQGSPQHAAFVFPAPSAQTDSTVQVSYGEQSPNVSGVRGSVDVRYGPTTAKGQEKPMEVK